jgi:SAM-dependent methyltransferase
MKIELLKLLCCPSCSGELALLRGLEGRGEIKSGTLGCAGCAAEFEVDKYVPRFVPAVNYSENFGFQWKRFSATQLDSRSGHPISRARFFHETGWTPEDLHDAVVLDAGCGSGRFAEIALNCGATVIAMDYSAAVDACWNNLHDWPRFHAVQADIRHLPFRNNSFDYVYSFGVLQHTPEPRSAFAALPQCLKSGGLIAVDIYRLTWKCLVMPKYWLRPVTKRLPAKFLFRLVSGCVPILLPVSRLVARLPKVGGRLRYLIPVANYEGILPLSREQLFEWALLDTFDMLSPAYDKPQTSRTIQRWFEEAGLQDVQIVKNYLAVGKGRKASTAHRKISLPGASNSSALLNHKTVASRQ